MSRLLTQAQFARKKKLSRSRISQLVKEGIIILDNGRIDPKKAGAAIEANVDRSRHSNSENGKISYSRKRSSPKSKHDAPTLTETRRDHELLKKQLTELILQIKRGELVNRGQAVEWLVSIVIVAKTAFWNLPRRMAETLALITDHQEIEVELQREIRVILEELARSLPEEKRAEVLGGGGGDPEFEKRLEIRRNEKKS